MKFHQVLLLFILFSLIFHKSSIFGAENTKIFEPFSFRNVHLPEILPEEQRLLEETENKLKTEAEIPPESFEVLRKFLILESEKYPHEKGSFPSQKIVTSGNCAWIWETEKQSGPLVRQNIAEKIRAFLETLPPETQCAWRIWVDENLKTTLNSELEFNASPTPEHLKRWIRENPFSSYEAELWELLAQNAWQSGNVGRAVRCWEMELHLRAKRMEEPSKNLFLPELPSTKTIQKQLKIAQKMAEIPDSEHQQKPIENGSKTPEEKWRVSMTQIVSPEGETIFEDLLPENQRGTLFPNRTRNLTLENEEIPQFLAFTPDKNFLVARLGTRVSIWPTGERDTRPQAYITVLDLSRGGQLVWFKPPVSVESVFIGNPLADANFVYIPVLQIRKNAEISLVVYSLADGTLQKNIPLFTADFPEVQITGRESIFLPIRWTREKNIQVGGITSHVQVTVDPY